MDPAGGDEKRISCVDGDSDGSRDEISKEGLVLVGRGDPIFVALEVGFSGGNEAESFATFDDVVPDASASKIDVEVGIATFDTHKAVVLDLRERHLAT